VTEIDQTDRQYAFSLQDADTAERLTTLMENSQAEISEHDRHMFLGYSPLEVRPAEPLRTIPRFLTSHPLLFGLPSAQRLMPTSADSALCAAALLAGVRAIAPGHQLQSAHGTPGHSVRYRLTKARTSLATVSTSALLMY
jgi:hypothetical protein